MVAALAAVDSAHPSSARVAASIISHGHGELVLALVRQLLERAEPCLRRVIVTLNTPEPALARSLQNLPAAHARLQLIQNDKPAGYGVNHNAAFASLPQDDASHYVVLNPDLQLLQPDTLARLLAALEQPGCALAYPRLVGADGQLQDNERELPSPSALWRRRALGRRERRVDWVSGACMVMRAQDWQHIQGFDEKFFMYCEDVDLSLRVRQQLGGLIRADTSVLHLAQRASHGRPRHLLWHVRSLLRLWRRPSFRWAKAHPSTALRASA